MREYENQVQKIKNQVYEKVAKYAFQDQLLNKLPIIAEELNQGPNPSHRCCVYHERAVTNERVHMSMGGDKTNDNIIEVLSAACDQCTEQRYVVTESCRGCLAHRCQGNCPIDAITIINSKAIIDYDKCVECGRCHKACPYNAINDVLRPCIKACPTNAISIDENKKAVIDNSKCIRCGACVYRCPFGAVQDKSQLIDVIESIKNSDDIYAVIAPAIATQFDYGEIGQIVTAMKMIGFKDVVEVALGADMVAIHEAEEFIEKMKEPDTVMTSSCCPGFARYINQEFPELSQLMSSTISPMIASARLIKSMHKNSKVVFVGPCIAKKDEEQIWQLNDEIDFVLTFEELTGMIDSKELDLKTLKSSPLNNASSLGRGFAATGGVAKALETVVKLKAPDLEYETIICDGLEECKKTLNLVKHKRIKGAFIEGMACKGGCIKGPVTMHYGNDDKKKLISYCKNAYETSTMAAMQILEESSISFHHDTNHVIINS